MPDERPAPYLSVVIPAYNESARIGDSLDRLTAWLAAPGRAGAPAVPGAPARREGPVEIIVVDDGSADGTVAAVERTAAGLARGADAQAAGSVTLRLLRNGVNHGKGYSIKHGVLLAAGRFILLSDADFSTPIDELPRLLGPVAAGECDIAIGSRGMAASNIEVRQPFWREGMGRTFNKIVRGVTGLPFTDTQCGFKVMRREPVLPLFRAARIERFAYDVEILYLARKVGLAVREIPVRWKNAPGSKVHAVRDSFSMLCDVARIVARDRSGRYGRLGEK